MAKRHIHMPNHLATQMNLNDGAQVAVEVTTDERSLIFKDCVLRVSDQFKLEMHLDTDEANAGSITDQTVAKILKEMD